MDHESGARDFPVKPLRPFKIGDYLSGSSLDTLRDWLVQHCEQSIQLTDDYKIGDLVDDLDKILDGMWSDSIDARGEDR